MVPGVGAATQAEEKRARERSARERERAADERELAGQLSSRVLCEQPEYVLPTGRVRVDLYKGMTAGERAAVRHGQAQQRAEAEARRARDRACAYDWALKEASEARAATLLERARARAARADAEAMRDLNAAKAKHDRARWNHLEREVYTNPPTEDFFLQFGTTSR
ncbi:RIB43A-like with coiled-coils protein 1 [Cladochytrium tenue]|nr:RIB43A-like with coiled-coils protein 1 [Cladochytrium tenue]